MNYPQKLLDGVTRHMESRFPVGESTNGYMSVTGEKYIVLVIGGVKAEGEEVPQGEASHAAACDAFKAEFDKFSAGKDGALYWRRKPGYSETFEPGNMYSANPAEWFGPHTGWQVSARFLISSKPPLARHELAEAGWADFCRQCEA